MSGKTPVIHRFDVFLVNLDPTIGAEIKKSRPCVIISPDVMNKHLNTVIVAPLTSTSKYYPSRIISKFNDQTGEIVLDQIRAIDKLRLIKKLGVIDKRTAEGVCKILHTMFQFQA